jgi:2-dehydropantoate 2-reductase
MRYIMYGAGGVGCLIGGKLFMHGFDVVLIGRGAHLEAIQRNGLKLQHPNPDAIETLPIKAVAHPSEIEFRDGDVVFLTMKSQDTDAALQDLRLAAGRDDIPIVCAQNGVENERLALRIFRNVYGMLVIMPASYTEPGLVDTTTWPTIGATDLGRFPRGTDATAEAIAADLTAAGFNSEALTDIMPLKYSKLNQNLVNAVQAIFPPEAKSSDITDQMRAECEACYAAAGIDMAPTAEMLGRNRGAGAPGGIGGGQWRGGSTWQSLARGAGSGEGDFINGEIALLGRLHGIPTPANEVLQLYVDRLARLKQPPGSVDIEEVRAEIRRRAEAYAPTK